jgi:SanA protein
MQRPLRRFIGASVFLAFGTAALVVGADAWVRAVGGAYCHDRVQDVPPAKVAVLLGCAQQLANGRSNRFFRHRIEAAVALHEAGRVKCFIVSGDNSRKDYDEPGAMREALVAAGVPRDRIWCDYAGLRTLDSVVRARRIFGQEAFVIVSQRFHNERAVFLGRRLGLGVHGFNAADVPLAAAPATYLRETLARLKAVLDVTVLGTQPRHGGPPIEIRL